MQDSFTSDGFRLDAHVARPADADAGAVADGRPGLVLCHGFPSGPQGAVEAARTYPELADRIAAGLGWTVLTFSFRGVGTSAGSFSLGGWLADLQAAVTYLLGRGGVDKVWLVGSGTGGSLAVCAAGEDERVAGVATLAARADFDDWAAHPRRFLDHARDVGVVRDAAFPDDMDSWARELKEVRPLSLVGKLSPRPLLLVHGSEDESVPVNDARALADYHGQAELRVIGGAGHQLRHDPRAIALLLGWLTDRQSETA